MAQWTETLEPYIKVQERVKSATLNPSAGEDLIIGVALISDAGPSTPTLITSQQEFLSTSLTRSPFSRQTVSKRPSKMGF